MTKSGNTNHCHGSDAFNYRLRNLDECYWNFCANLPHQSGSGELVETLLCILNSESLVAHLRLKLSIFTCVEGHIKYFLTNLKSDVQSTVKRFFLAIIELIRDEVTIGIEHHRATLKFIQFAERHQGTYPKLEEVTEEEKAEVTVFYHMHKKETCLKYN